MTKRKKILIFSTTYLPFIGGAELALKEITERTKNADFDLITLRFDSSLPRFEKIGNVGVYRIGSSSDRPAIADLSRFPLHFNKFIFPILAAAKARRLHKKNRYNAIWSMMASYAGFAALFFKIAHPKVPYLLTLQEGDPTLEIKRKVRYLYQLFRMIFTRADFVQAISSYLGEWAREMGYRGPLEVVPNGVDIEKFKVKSLKLKVKEGLNIKEGDKIIITASRLVKKNAVGDIIEALKFLPANVKLLIAGIGPLEEELRLQVISPDKVEDSRQSRNYKLQERVLFLGHMSHDELPGYLALADVFVRPSLSEGLGSAFLEAMAAGVPVIATPVGGIPDFLKDGETGLFCEANNPKSVADKIKLVLENDALRKSIITNAGRMIEERYDWNKIAQKMEWIFDRLSPYPSVLICTGIYPPDIGGPATYSETLADELPGRGIAVSVLSFGEVRRLPKLVRHFTYFLKVLWRGRKANVIFAQDPVSVGWPSSVAARLLGKRFVLKVVGDYAWEQCQMSNVKYQKLSLEDFQIKRFDRLTESRKKIERRVAKSADLIIVPSEYLKKIVLMWGVEEKKVKIIYNAVEMPNISETKEELKKELGLNGKIILSAGRLVPWKGFSALIDVMPDIFKKVPDAILVIVGDGHEKSVLELQVMRYKLQDRVILTGKLPHDKLMKYLKAAEVFVLNTAYEGFSHQILEAMAVGTPVVTTDVCGNPELVRSGDNGLLIKFGDEERLYQAILRVFSDDRLRSSLSSSGIETAKRFLKDKMIEESINALT